MITHTHTHTPPTTHPGPLPTVVLGEHDLSLGARSVQDFEALADVDLLWDIRSGGEEARFATGEASRIA